MAAYMASLMKLQQRDDRIYYPGHGEAIENPRRLVRGLIGHRKQREGQILRLIGCDGIHDVHGMVARMYVGIDPRLSLAAGIGRASCRERVVQYVYISGGVASLQKKKSTQDRT